MTAVLNDPAYAARVEVVASTGRTGSPQAEFHERFDLVGDAWRRSIEFAGRPDTPARDTVYLAGETMDRTSAEVWTLRGESDPETIGVAAFLVELAAAFAESAPRTIDGEALDHLAAPVPRPLAVALLDGLVPANRLPDDLEANADAFLDPDGAPVLLELNVSWLQTQPGVPGTAYELKASYRFESGEVGEITRPASVWARFASDQFSYGAIRRDGRPSRRAARSRRIS